MSVATLIDSHDSVGLGQLLRQGEVSAVELLQAVWQRMDARNPALNALASRHDALALQQAQAYRPELATSPVSGVPMLLKDALADMAGVVTRSGTALSSRFSTPTQDAELVRRYRAAGLVFAGKTTLPELGLTTSTESVLYGDTCNPWDVTRTPGGSSGGAAAAVAARMVPIAHGSDGGGSIRIPASNCGVFGLKPGRGRSPAAPGWAESWQGFVTEHVLTRSVRDSAALLDVMLTPTPHSVPSPALYNAGGSPAQGYLAALQQPLRPLRIAYSLRPFLGGTVCEESQKAVLQAAQLLQDLGHTVDEAAPELASPATLIKVMATVVTGSLAMVMDEIATKTGQPVRWHDVEPATWILSRQGRLATAGDMVWARETALRQAWVFEKFHQQWDVLLTPTMNQLPSPIGAMGLLPSEAQLSSWLIGRLGLDRLLKYTPMVQRGLTQVMEYMGWTNVMNMTGQPSMSVPLYWSAPTATAPLGLPVGTMFTAPFADELTLLQLAQQLEQAQPWWNRMPPLRLQQ